MGSSVARKRCRIARRKAAFARSNISPQKHHHNCQSDPTPTYCRHDYAGRTCAVCNEQPATRCDFIGGCCLKASGVPGFKEGDHLIFPVCDECSEHQVCLVERFGLADVARTIIKNLRHQT